MLGFWTKLKSKLKNRWSKQNIKQVYSFICDCIVAKNGEVVRSDQTSVKKYCIHLWSSGLLSCGWWVVIWRWFARPWKKITIKLLLLWIKWRNLIQKHLISYHRKSLHIPKGQMSVFRWSRIKWAVLRWRVIPPNNGVGLCCTVVYITIGDGHFHWHFIKLVESRNSMSTSLPRTWIDKAAILLAYSAHFLIPPTSGGWWGLSSGCCMSGLPRHTTHCD